MSSIASDDDLSTLIVKKASPFSRNVFTLYKMPPLTPQLAENEQGVLDKLKTETVQFLHSLFEKLPETEWVTL